jgi:hypothetical protein
MTFRLSPPTLARWTSISVTIAVLAKVFVPFYLMGSTAIFTASVAIGLILVSLGWQPIFAQADHVRYVLIMTGLFYAVIVVGFLAYSRPVVPVTYLWGILIIHGIFLIFGFSAARDLRAVLLVLVGMGAIYAAVLLIHAVRFSGVTTGVNVDDIFGIGVPAIYITFHQNIGLVLGIGAIAAFGLASKGVARMLALIALPIVLVLLFHIAARTALVALASSLILLGLTELWAYSKKAAVLTSTVVILSAIIVVGILSQHPLNSIDADATAPDTISRTIRELQDPRPGFRMQIWKTTLHRIVDETSKLPLGRGIGMYPVDAGFGAPDWLFHPTKGSSEYPHNVHLEILYETGIVGFLLFSALMFFPLIVSLRQWTGFSPEEKSALAIYFFFLVSSEISGAFAYTYLLQFFFALSVGTIAIKRTAEANTHHDNEAHFNPPRSAIR